MAAARLGDVATDSPQYSSTGPLSQVEAVSQVAPQASSPLRERIEVRITRLKTLIRRRM
jgi:hypothetical protein